MVRFNDKNNITQLSNDDILPMTDLSDTSEDKKVTVQQLSQYTVDNIPNLSNGKSLTDNNLSDGLKSNYDEAYRGTAEGIAKFDENKEYSIGDIVKVLDKDNKPVLYYATSDNNIGNNPVADDGAHWIELTLSSGGGLEVLDIGWALHVDEDKNTRRILNGQLIMQDQFDKAVTKLKTWVNTYPNLFCTEEEWQAEKTLSALGQVGKFVIDDVNGTVRLPSIVNVVGATNLYQAGLRQEQGLPNITGTAYGSRRIDGIQGTTGALYWMDKKTDNSRGAITTGDSWAELSIDASKSNPIYGNSTNVQLEAIKGVWFIQLNSEIEETGKPINSYTVNNVFSFGMSQYYKGIMNNSSWLRSNGQWNKKALFEDLYAWILENLNEGNEGFKFSTDEYNDYDFVVRVSDETFRLPLKNGTEGVFANGVKGNGKPIVVTDGNGNERNMFQPGNDYLYTNDNVGGTLPHITSHYSGGASTSFALGTNVGLTTDPTKSGMVVDTTVPQGYNLYYYCGDTLQNTDLINIARVLEILADFKINKLKLNCYREQFILPGNTHKSIQIKGDTYLEVNINGANRKFYNKDLIELNVLDILDTGTSLTAGKDYYIYLIQNPSTHEFTYKVSMNATFPSGATNDNSYKIGGFHTLCVSVTSSNAPALPANSLWSTHPAIGYNAGDIIPNSIWCETHRPQSNPEGMVYVDLLDMWVDIYLQSGTYKNTASKFGATVTDSRTPIQHLWDMQLNGKRLARDAEFMIFAEGSNQKTTIQGASAPNPKTSGGHVDTAGKRMISGYFIEECCGYLWQWLDEIGFNGQGNWAGYGDENTRGNCYGMNYILRAGGAWGSSSNCGSRSRHSYASRAYVAVGYGGRGVSLPKFSR